MDYWVNPLLKADRRIAQAEMAVIVQIAEIDKLRVAGRNIAVAERIVLAFVKSLEVMREQKASLVA